MTQATAGIDTLCGGNIEPDKPAPTIEREHLKHGAIVKHRSSRSVQTTNGNSMIHVFSLGAAPDAPWFSLWGSANLNSQLRKAKPGALVLLRYTGQAPNDDGSPGAHQWEVKPTTVSVEAVRVYLTRDDEAQNMVAIMHAIENAGAADRERRDARRATTTTATTAAAPRSPMERAFPDDLSGDADDLPF